MSETASAYLAGRRNLSGTPPKTYGSGRVCEDPDCTTVISMYNKESKCHQHKPLRKIRIRGRSPSEIMDKDTPVVHSCRDCILYTGNLFEGLDKVLLDGTVHVQGKNGKGTFCEA